MKTSIRQINLSRKMVPCPKCQTMSKRHCNSVRIIKEVALRVPKMLKITYSKHYCVTCKKHFSLPMGQIARSGSQFTNRVRRIAVDLVMMQALTLEKASQKMSEKYKVHVPATTLHDWVVEEMRP